MDNLDRSSFHNYPKKSCLTINFISVIAAFLLGFWFAKIPGDESPNSAKEKRLHVNSAAPSPSAVTKNQSNYNNRIASSSHPYSTLESSNFFKYEYIEEYNPLTPQNSESDQTLDKRMAELQQAKGQDGLNLLLGSMNDKQAAVRELAVRKFVEEYTGNNEISDINYYKPIFESALHHEEDEDVIIGLLEFLYRTSERDEFTKYMQQVFQRPDLSIRSFQRIGEMAGNTGEYNSHEINEMLSETPQFMDIDEVSKTCLTHSLTQNIDD